MAMKSKAKCEMQMDHQYLHWLMVERDWDLEGARGYVETGTVPEPRSVEPDDEAAD